ncbi:hypothetical protein D3C73_1048930 [compost metagenome]
MGTIQHGAVAVPPFAERNLTFAVSQQKLRRLKLAEGQRIGADKRTDPQHHLEAQSMQLINHTPRLREAAGMKLPGPVRLMPVIVNHNDAGRHSACEHIPGILQDLLLGWLIEQLNP